MADTQDNAKIEKLWAQYKSTGDIDAKNEILLHYTYIVKWAVHRLMPKYSGFGDRDDLYSCGIIGLIDAIGKFDTEHGVKFETYALPRVRGEILDYMRSQDWAPPSLRRKINAITETYDALEAEMNDAPTEQRVADALDMPVTQVQKILNQAHIFNILNFEDALTAQNPVESISGSDIDEPENMLLDKERRETLASAIESLPEKERLVITLYYYEGLLLKEIADILHVTESRVSQIHSKALSRMSVKLKKYV